MARTDNYLIQAQQAKSCFLTYDAEALAKKLNRARTIPGDHDGIDGVEQLETARGRTETAMRRS